MVAPSRAWSGRPGTGDSLEGAELARYYALNQRVFGLLAPWYDSLVVRLLPPGLRRRAVDFCAAPTGARVLDVATGTGAQALAFAERGHEVVGIDLVEEMLVVARRKPGSAAIRFDRMDATALPYADGSFDVTTISFGLHDMPHPVRMRVLYEMARVTRPGGRVLVVDYGLPSNPLWRRLAVGVISTWERAWYREFLRHDPAGLLASAGFVVDGQETALRGAVRMLRGHLPVAPASSRPGPGSGP